MKVVGTDSFKTNSPTADNPSEPVALSNPSNEVVVNPDITVWYLDTEFTKLGDTLIDRLRKRFEEVEHRGITDDEIKDYTARIIKSQL